MQPKTHRKCVTCGSEFRKFKTTDKYCSPQCANVSTKTKPQSRIKTESEKEKERKAKYRPIAIQYKLDNPICQICNKRKTTDVHHKAGRIGCLLFEVSLFMALCRKCHREVHDNPKIAREKGYLI